MSLYTVWSRSDFKAAIRRELMDTGTKWTSELELNQYLDDWLDDIQQEFEFVWAVSTITAGTGTTPYVIDTSTFTPTMLRCEAVYYNGFRLSGRLLQNVEVGMPEWRANQNDTPRLVANYPDSRHVLVWPTPSDPTAELVFEYPSVLSFASDSSTSGLPVWTQWCAKPYVCSAVYQRPGPINDPKRARRYWAQYMRSKERVRSLWESFLPERYRRMTPGGQYEADILCPPPAFTNP